MKSHSNDIAARLIQREVGNMFNIEAKSLFGNTMITVTKVYILGKLTKAKVYLSLFTKEDKKAIIDKINKEDYILKNMLVHRIKNKIRFIPDIEYCLDDSMDYYENIENLLKK